MLPTCPVSGETTISIGAALTEIMGKVPVSISPMTIRMNILVYAEFCKKIFVDNFIFSLFDERERCCRLLKKLVKPE